MDNNCISVSSSSSVQVIQKKRSKGRECAAYGCGNTFYDANGERTGLHFFKFPMKNPEKLVWCNRIKRQDGQDGFKVTIDTYICQIHFKDSDIRKNPNTWRLNKDVAPSLHLFESLPIAVTPRRKPPKNRTQSASRRILTPVCLPFSNEDNVVVDENSVIDTHSTTSIQEMPKTTDTGTQTDFSFVWVPVSVVLGISCIDVVE